MRASKSSSVFNLLKNSVTIIGPSAGGASVTYLMASPLTKGTK